METAHKMKALLAKPVVCAEQSRKDRDLLVAGLAAKACACDRQ